MIIKNLFAELKSIQYFFVKVTVAFIATVTLIIMQNFYLTLCVNQVLINQISIIWRSCWIVMLIIFAKSITGFFTDQYLKKISMRIKNQLREMLFHRLILKGPVELKQDSKATYSSFLFEGIDKLEIYLNEFVPQLIYVAVVVPMILGVCFYTDWISALIMLVTAPLIPIFMILIGKMSEYIHKKQWKTLQQLNSFFLDLLKGYMTLKYLGKANEQTEKIIEINEAFRLNTMNVLKVSFLSALVLELIGTISTALIAVSLGVRLIYNQMDFENAFFILLMVPEYYGPIRQLGTKFHTAMSAQSVVTPIYQMLNSDDTLSPTHKENPLVMAEPTVIALKDISFAYQPNKVVIESLDLLWRKGEKIVIMGESGAGKSTLIHLLLGFITQQKGEYTIQGDVLVPFQTQMTPWIYAFVPQHPNLFALSLRENLILNKTSISENELDGVLEKVGLYDWKKTLDNGYDTMLGEGGIGMSGGQLQLLSIARALIIDAPFIIMDEPSSALDYYSDERMKIAIKNHFEHKGILVIAHRKSTIDQAENLYELIDKKLVCRRRQYNDAIS